MYRGARLKIPNRTSALMLTVLLAGCGGTNADGIYDPFEPVNREVFAFNHSLDRHAALPAASYYRNAVPGGVRTGVHNFLSNLGLPVTFANDVLQGDLTHAGYSVCRLGVNSTVGVLGVMDPASGYGCPGRDEDFGQTLGVYGVPGGPYLVMPLLGATLPRDIAGRLLVDHYFNPLSYLQYNGKTYVGLGQSLIKVVDQRSRAVGALREVERTSVDYYAAMRRLYVERRNDAIHNTSPDPTGDSVTAPPAADRAESPPGPADTVATTVPAAAAALPPLALAAPAK
jgi:phospholipid-binding lipoprotein MlaA